MKTLFDVLGWVGTWGMIVVVILAISPAQDSDGKDWDWWIPFTGSSIIATAVIFIALWAVYG